MKVNEEDDRLIEYTWTASTQVREITMVFLVFNVGEITMVIVFNVGEITMVFWCLMLLK